MESRKRAHGPDSRATLHAWASACALGACVLTAPARGEDGVLATVDDAIIRKSDVADSMSLFSRQAFVEGLRSCVQRALVDLEAQRLAVSVSERAVEDALTAELEQEKSAVLVQLGGKTSFDDFVRESFRMTPEAYKDGIRRAVRTKLLLGRVIRYGLMREERLDLRTIVVKSKATANELKTKIADGADFITLARRESSDASAKEGGRLPPVTRGVLQPAIEKAVFDLFPGQVSDVLTVTERGETTYHLFRLLERQDSSGQSFADVAAEVERGLSERPLEPFEIAQWSRKMETIHRVVIAGFKEAVLPPASEKKAEKSAPRRE